MERITVTGKQLPGDDHNLRLDINNKSFSVSLAQYLQVHSHLVLIEGILDPNCTTDCLSSLTTEAESLS